MKNARDWIFISSALSFVLNLPINLSFLIHFHVSILKIELSRCSRIVPFLIKASLLLFSSSKESLKKKKKKRKITRTRHPASNRSNIFRLSQSNSWQMPRHVFFFLFTAHTHVTLFLFHPTFFCTSPNKQPSHRIFAFRRKSIGSSS